jgi:hypothetical protein
MFGVYHRILTTTVGSLLILVPVGILYLGGLSKPASFVVVVVFSFIFATAMLTVEKRLGHVLVGVVAYIAVLVTFLANVA